MPRPGEVPYAAPETDALLDDPLDSIVLEIPKPSAPLWTRALRRLSHRLSRQLSYAPCTLDLPRPLASFTFDDVPASAHLRGAAALERYGVRGTFYISTGLLGRRTSRWRVIDRAGVADLFERGHELGLHTHSHRAMGSLSREEFADDLSANIAALREIAPAAPLQSFAFPFGTTALRHRDVLARNVRSSRSIFAGINHGTFDRYFIKSIELGDARLSQTALEHFLAEAQRHRGWIIFMTHDVGEAPSQFGATPERLEMALAMCRRLGFDIATVSSAVAMTRPA